MISKYFKLLKDLIVSKKWIVLLILCVVPLCYVGFYVGAYSNIDENTENFKVGVVLEDQGYKNQNFAEKFKTNLSSNKQVKWVFYDSQSDAKKDLAKYDNIYLYITIPDGFTKKVVNIKDKFEVSKLWLGFTLNPKKNGMITSISDILKQKLKNTVKNEITKTAVQEINKKIPDATKKVDKVKDGLKKLDDGTSMLAKSLNGASVDFSNEKSYFDKQKSLFEDSLLYKNLPNVKSYLDEANKFLVAVTNDQKTLSIDSFDNIAPQISSLYNSVEISPKIKSLINIEMQNLIKVSNDYKTILSSTKDINSLLDVKNKLNVLKQFLKNNNNLDFLNELISKDKILASEFKSKLIAFNSKVKLFKLNLFNIINSFESILSHFENDKKLFENYLNEPLYKKIKDITGLDMSNIEKLLDLLNKSKIDGIENSLTNDINNIVSLSNHVSKNMSHINDQINLLIDEVDFNDLEKHSNDYVSSTLSPIKIQTEDLNKKQIFGAIFAPMTIALGIWFLLVFMFTALVKSEELDNDFIPNLMYKNTLAVVLSMITWVIVTKLISFQGINIYHYGELLLAFVAYAWCIGNLFLILYYYLNTYARYILTILLVINVTSGAVTYPIETLFPIFKVISPFTPFKYFIDAIRETIATNFDFNLFINNVYVLFGVGTAALAVNIIIWLIRKLIMKKFSN